MWNNTLPKGRIKPMQFNIKTILAHQLNALSVRAVQQLPDAHNWRFSAGEAQHPSHQHARRTHKARFDPSESLQALQQLHTSLTSLLTHHFAKDLQQI